jgi:STE24 endopeptidase
MQYNHWFIAIVLAIFLLWKLDFFATLLNLRALDSPLPQALEGVIDAETLERSRDYTRARSVLGIGEGVFSLVLLFTFWWLGGFGWLDQWVRGLGLGPVASGLVFIGTIAATLHVLSLPFDLYATFGIESAFGFNRTTLPTWLFDQAKSALLALLIGAPLLAALLWIFSAVPLAWLWGWLLASAFSLFLAYLAPTWIMPLFNRFEPLPEGELKRAIHEMAERCEFPLAEVLVMDGSKRSTKSNAFFTGLGDRKRIALFDTLIERHTVPELVAVLAHEIGHYRERHIAKSLAIGIATTGALFFLLGLMLENRALFDAFGIERTSVYASFTLFAILMSPVSDVFSYAGRWLSRKHEYEADAYAARAMGDPGPMVEALRKLSRDNLSNPTPHPFYVFLNYTHPPVAERIAALRRLDLGDPEAPPLH